MQELGPNSLGRPARGHLLLTKTLLIVGQEGGMHREGDRPEKVPDFEISDPKLCAHDRATGKLVWRSGATPQRDGGANGLHAERQTIHHRSHWGF
jgi:hypothetical protein